MLYDVEERRIINHLPEDMVNPLTGKRYAMAYNEGFFDGLRNAYSKVKSVFSKKTPSEKKYFDVPDSDDFPGFDPNKATLIMDNGRRKSYRNPDGSTTYVYNDGSTDTFTLGADHRQKRIHTPPTNNSSQQSAQSTPASTNQPSSPNSSSQQSAQSTPTSKQPIPPRTTSTNQPSSPNINTILSNNTSKYFNINTKNYKNNMYSKNSGNGQQQQQTISKQPIPPRTTSGSQSANQVSQNGSTATNNTYTSTGQQDLYRSQPVTVTRTKVGEKRVVDDPNIQRVTLPDGREAIQTTSYIKTRPDKFIDRAKLAWVGAKQVFKDEMKSSGALDKLKSLFGFGKKSVRESYNYYNNEYDDFRDHLYRK